MHPNLFLLHNDLTPPKEPKGLAKPLKFLEIHAGPPVV